MTTAHDGDECVEVFVAVNGWTMLRYATPAGLIPAPIIAQAVSNYRQEVADGTIPAPRKDTA